MGISSWYASYVYQVFIFFFACLFSCFYFLDNDDVHDDNQIPEYGQGAAFNSESPVATCSDHHNSISAGGMFCNFHIIYYDYPFANSYNDAAD